MIRVQTFFTNHAVLTVKLNGTCQLWLNFFESLTEEQWQRSGVHPESGEITVESLLITYADHGEGHLDQISRTLAAKP